MNDILKLNAVEASAAMQKGDTSSVELTKAYLAAADATAALNNYVTLCEDKALEMAQQSDKRRADGRVQAIRRSSDWRKGFVLHLWCGNHCMF